MISGIHQKRGKTNIPMVSRGMVKDPVTDPVLDFRNRVTKLLHHGLSLQSLNGV